MKLKDVCAQTGLTQKTVRFYEEKQLICPKSVMKNGRSYREYCDADVRALQEIAILRKAFFSLEEIYLMQQDPEDIPEILRDYTRRISVMAVTIDALSNTLGALDVNAITDISDLAQTMDPATKRLPLPSYDLKPSFRHIEKAETEELIRLRQDKLQRTGDSPFFLEQQQFTNRLGLFTEYYSHNEILSAGTANFPKPQEPKLLRIINLCLSTAIVILTLTICYFILQRRSDLVAIWDEIKVRIISLDLSLISLRLITGHIYQLIHQCHDNRTKRGKLILIVAAEIVLLFVLNLGTYYIHDKPNRAPVPDYSVAMAIHSEIPEEMIYEFEILLQSQIEDFNADNRVMVEVEVVNISEENGQTQLYNLISSGQCVLFIMDEMSYGRYIYGTADTDIAILPADLQSNHSPVLCDISDAPFLKDIGIEDTKIYGFIYDYNEKLMKLSIDILDYLRTARIQLWY